MNDLEKIIYDALVCISDMAMIIGDAVGVAEDEKHKIAVMNAVNKFEKEITPIYSGMLSDAASGISESGMLLMHIENVKREFCDDRK